MRLFLNPLATSQAEKVVNNPFSQEASVDPINFPNDWKGFPGIWMQGSRLYSMYRYGSFHNQDEGSMSLFRYSDNDGETWSSDEVLWDGLELYDLYPDEPLGKLDIRDAHPLVMSNGKLLIIGFALMTNIQVGYARRYDINGDTFDLDSVEMTIVDNNWENSIPIEHNGIIYSTTYDNLDDTGPTWLYTSNDYGVTWSLKSKITPYNDDIAYAGNELGITFIGEKLVVLVRQAKKIEHDPAYPNILLESDDYGATWTNPRYAEYRHDGPCAYYLGDNKVAIMGRTPFAYQDNITSYLSVIDWTTGAEISGLELEADPDFQPKNVDRGYGQIIKYRDKYFVVYYKGQATTTNLSNGYGGVYFRQLNYNESTYTFTFGND